jgi:hypothetical protein
MAKLPRQPDPDRLRALAPAVITLPAGTTLHRIYFRGGAHPTRWKALRYFGPTGARFDHHLPDAGGRGQLQERGITYVAADILTCLAEVFQGTTRTIRRTRRSPWLVSFPLKSDVRLLDLTGTFALRAGASMKLMSGPVSYAQNWARGFYEVYPDIHGLYYPSSLTNRPAVALSERVGALAVFPRTPVFHRALSDPLLLTPLRNAARELNYDLAG